jgi:DNA-binding NtrC family response regulator
MKNASPLASPLIASSNSLIPHILVVDDDPALCSLLLRFYEQSGYTSESAASGEEALALLAQHNIDFVITDIKLPGINGLELVAKMKEHFPDVPVMVITGCSEIDTAINVLKNGACDFVIKPFDLVTVHESTRIALDKTRVNMEMRHLRRSLKEGYAFDGMFSKTPEMHRIFEIVRAVAPTEMTVSIEGETGTGKELLANAVHSHSSRRNKPFVTINCAGFPESLLESELFGYERGAFTGAVQSKAGKIELAHGGTLFLDEIESMSLVMQGKLLRVLEDQHVQRLGGHASIHVDMRVITATNVPLKELVAAGKMRSDFYYRISVIPIHLIPLRQRKVDIPILAHHFLQRQQVGIQKDIKSISKKALQLLLNYAWPGNIRELQNVLQRAIVLNSGRTIHHVHLPGIPTDDALRQSDSDVSIPLRQWLVEKEKHYLVQKLNDCGGNVGLTAKSCRIGVRTLSRKIQQYGLDKAVFKQREVTNFEPTITTE